MTSVLANAFLFYQTEETKSVVAAFSTKTLAKFVGHKIKHLLESPKTLISSSSPSSSSSSSSSSASINTKKKENKNNNNNNNKKEKLRKFFRSYSPPFFTFIELFAGAGGFSLAAEKLGGNCIFASDIDSNAKKAWLDNFSFSCSSNQKNNNNNNENEVFHFGDIRKIPDSEIPQKANNNNNNNDIDLLVGGFPCQKFSRCGEMQAFESDDGNLYLEVVRFLKVAKPRMFLLENVPGILAAAEKQALKIITDSLSDAGYDVTTAVIDSSTLVPQVRRRLYFVGFRRNEEELLLNFKINNNNNNNNPKKEEEQSPTKNNNENENDSSSNSNSVGEKFPRRRDRTSASASSCSSSTKIPKPLPLIDNFSFPRFPTLNRKFQEIIELDENIFKNFCLTESQWNKKKEITNGDEDKWMINLNAPAMTLMRSYHRGPGSNSGKKFMQTVSDAAQKVAAENEKMCGETEEEAQKIPDRAFRKLIRVPNSSSVSSASAASSCSQNNNNNNNKNSSSSSRWITNREACRMQGFPEYFSIHNENNKESGGVCLMGNAVTVPVIAGILHAMFNVSAANVDDEKKHTTTTRTTSLLFRRNLYSAETDLRMLLKEILVEALPERSIAAFVEEFEKCCYETSCCSASGIDAKATEQNITHISFFA